MHRFYFRENSSYLLLNLPSMVFSQNFDALAIYVSIKIADSDSA